MAGTRRATPCYNYTLVWVLTVDGRTVLYDPLGGGDTDPDRDQWLPNNCGAHCCAWLLLWQRDPELTMDI